MTIMVPESLEDKRKISLNYVKGEAKVQVDQNDYTEGTDVGNDKAESKP